MFGHSIEDEFINKISAADATVRSRSAWPVIMAVIIGLAALGVWATIFEIEEVTSGTGRVIPSSQVQVVQSLEGGLLRELAVAEGDTVEEGTVLAQIDDTSFSSQLGELQQQESGYLAEQYRLQSEADYQDDLQFPEDLKKLNPQAVAAETALFLSRRSQLSKELEVLHNRLSQREAELRETDANTKKLEEMIQPLTREVEISRGLFRRGVVPEIEFLQLQSELAEVRGDLEVGAAGRPRIEASILEAKNQIAASKSAYVLTARERLAKLQIELAVVQETIKAASDRVTRTQVKAPVRGIVNKINLTTIGAVLRPGDELLEIVPVDDSLLIEADIRPQDVAFIKPNEPASVKITAYDYLVYGSLNGEVIRIGADTEENREGEEFFKVVVRTDKNFLGNDDNPLAITPGMVASVDIKTGKKTVMTYLLKPILRAQSEALRER